MGALRSAPFARAKAMLATIHAAFGLATFDAQQAALAQVGPYRSRGKGQGCLGNKHSRHTVAMDKRAAEKTRNRGRA